jgi:hypothetical protein
MLATPNPVIRPASSSGPYPAPPNPTISSPPHTMPTAMNMLRIVISTL